MLQGMIVAELALRAMALTNRKIVSIYTIADLCGGDPKPQTLNPKP